MNIKARLERIEKRVGVEKEFDANEQIKKVDFEMFTEIYADDDADKWQAEDFNDYPEMKRFIRNGYTLDQVFRMFLARGRN